MESIMPSSIIKRALPVDPLTLHAIYSGAITVYEIEGALYAYHGALNIPEIDPGILLEHAQLIQNGKYPCLVDARSLPTEEERKDSPAMYCENAQQARSELCLLDVASGILKPYKQKIFSLPAQLQEALVMLEQSIKEAILVHDKRIKAPLEAVLLLVEEQGYLSTFEEISSISDQPEKEFYYSVKYAVKRIKTLLQWYTLPTLYILREVSNGGTTCTILSSDQEVALMKFCHLWAYGHTDNSSVERWELCANDTVIRVATSDSKDADLYSYSRIWEERDSAADWPL